MAPQDDDEATAQIDLEAMRRRGGTTPVEDVESEPPSSGGPPTAAGAGERFDDEEHTASDLQVVARAEPRARDEGASGANAGRAGRGGEGVRVVSAAALWSSSALLDESVVSSAPLTTVVRQDPPGLPKPLAATARSPDETTAPGGAAKGVSRAADDDPWPEGSDEWLASMRGRPPPLSPISLDEPTMVPRVDAPAWASPADAEPNTIVPRLLPRDLDGRLAFEPTVAIEEISEELLLDGTGELGVDATLIARPGAIALAELDIPLGTGDFESFEPDSAELLVSGETGTSDAESQRGADARSREEGSFFPPPIISSKQDFGYAEDLATDPHRSVESLMGPRARAPGSGSPEDLATDPLRALASLRGERDLPLPSFEPSSSVDVGASREREPAESDEAHELDSEVDLPHEEDEERSHFSDIPPAPQVSPSAWPAMDSSDYESVPSEPTRARTEPSLAGPLPLPGPSVAFDSSVPAWQSGADSEERALHDGGRWDDLCELLLSRIDRTPSPVPRARLLVRLSSVLEEKLADHAQAFDGLLDAYRCTPGEPDVLVGLERLAEQQPARFEVLVDTTTELLASARPPERLALLGNLVRWHEGPLADPQAAEHYAAEIERMDSAHPVLLLRRAARARERGDMGMFLDLSKRALDRTRLPRERVAIHVAMGEAQKVPTEAMAHLEAALELEPSSADVLLAYERVAARFDLHTEVQWALEQLLAHGDEAQKIDAHLRLAELLEKRFLKREEAAATLQALLALAPEHPAGRLALERCYLALRDWPRLVEAACARAELALTPREQADAFAFAAELSESKLGDQVGAAEQLRRATSLEPTNESYLGRAAKLAERMQEPATAAAYRARLAEILEDPRKQAEQYVAIAASLDDPLGARTYYERAAKADPDCVAAWEAIERLAREVGDERGSLAALRGRIEATDSQRSKAQLLVELGGRLAAAGELAESEDAFEAALKADPSNERAASAVLDVLVDAGRFAEAAPACELLVTAAARDRDPSVLYARLRTSARIAIGLGDLGKALGACVAAADALPEEPQPLLDMVEILSRASASDTPLLGARTDAAYQRVLARASELDFDALAKLGKLLAERGEHERAVELLTRVLVGGEGDDDADEAETGQRPVPGDGRALFEVLSESLVAVGDFQRAGDMKLRLARVTADPEAKYAALVATIELFAHRLGDLHATRPVVEEAIALKPDDHWLLHTAMWLYGELDDWARLAEVLERIVHVQETPERRAKSLFTLAQVVGDKLGDKARAAELYEEVLDADKTRLDAFESLTRSLDELGDYAALERAYRKMIARVRDDGDDALVFSLFKDLASVYADRLGDVDLAAKALEGAKRVMPENTEVKAAAIELLVSRDELDRAQELLRRDLERDPHDVRSYELLYGVYLRQRRFDRALGTAQVLAELRPPSAEVRQFIDDYPPCALGDVPGSLVEEAWTSHLFHHELDPMLTSVFAWMTPAVCRLREAQMTDAERDLAFGKPLTRALTRHAETIRTMFHDAAEILAFGGPELLVGRSPRNVPFTPSLTPYGAMLVDPDALTGAEPVLPYLVGKALAEQRPELAARAFFPAVTELTSLLATAVRVAMGERGSDTASQKLDRALVSVMTVDERDAVTQAVEVARAEGAPLDVKKWSQAADLSGMRVGLLLCQDVALAKKAITSEPRSPSDKTPREKLGELFLFATGDLYADLRQAVGVNSADGGPGSSE